MYRFRILISLILLVLSNALMAGELIVEAEGTAIKTATLPNNVYEARAIADALQSIVQSGAQSLESFSLVENGKVLFDQISAQSDIKIAGYRVLSTKDHGNKFSARLEVLILPVGQNQIALTCRQPLELDIALNWQGISLKKQMPFWMEIDAQSIRRKIASTITADGKFNISEKNPAISDVKSNYSLYEIDNSTAPSVPAYTITLSIELDIKNYINLLHREKILIVNAKSELNRGPQVINSTHLKADIELDKGSILINGHNSGRGNLDNIQRDITTLAQRSVVQTLKQLECKNFNSKINYKNKTLKIDFGLQDGLLDTDIFSSSEAGTKQYYFTVKEMGNNSTTLHSLSQDTNAKLFDGLNIQLLERF